MQGEEARRRGGGGGEGSPAFWPVFKVNNICSRFRILAEHELGGRSGMSRTGAGGRGSLLVTFSTQDEKPGKT